MPNQPARRWLPLRHRRALLEREAELVAESTAVGNEQQHLARQFLALRRELVEIHDQLWPSSPGHAYHTARRPRIPGPSPIPPPIAGAQPLRGRSLRYAALAVLVRARSPLTLAEIHRALHLAGYELASRNPVKQLGDALAYEERRGRARRVARATYAVGELSPSRRRAGL